MSGFLRAAVVLLHLTGALSYSYAESRAPPYVRIDSNDEAELRCSCYRTANLNLTVIYYNESSGADEVADFEATQLENSFGALLFTVDEMVTQINSAGQEGEVAVRNMRTSYAVKNSTLYSVTLTNPVPGRKYTCKFVWQSWSDYLFDYKASFTVIGENAALPTSNLTQYRVGSYVQMWEVQGSGFTPEFSIKFNDDWVKLVASNYTLSTQDYLYNGFYFVQTLEAIEPNYGVHTVEVTMHGHDSRQSVSVAQIGWTF
eukprot:sb/3468516/